MMRVVGVSDDGKSMAIRPVIARGEIVGGAEESIVAGEWMAMQTEQVAGLWTG